ncbi:hypothetical protein PsYK624_134960 [Phanerochaete sordida]|uniref:Uncharacterized protein n=1 Tax=Phanerochaete sordida TaxID=48140 RepID=A0A9P3GL48_9APHY|nr:hypothetical protein PsYK624_134960 [Phanerochaete sordida]
MDITLTPLPLSLNSRRPSDRPPTSLVCLSTFGVHKASSGYPEHRIYVHVCAPRSPAATSTYVCSIRQSARATLSFDANLRMGRTTLRA